MTALASAAFVWQGVRAMHVVIGNHHLSSVGGAETYLLTVAEQLTRFGHGVTVYGGDGGDFAGFLRARRIDVAIGLDPLPPECDAVIAQDAVSSLELAERYPRVRQLFVAHAAHLEMWFPPNLPHAIAAVVVMNDRVRARLDALAADHELVRLRQPIDTGRFSPREPLARPRRRVLALGNYLIGRRRDALREACEAVGMELVQVGRHGTCTHEPERTMRDCDIVVGHGRSVLEGMSAGLAAYVYDLCGTDGWVTPESYPALESDGFAGSATGAAIGREELVRDLAAWQPRMGTDNRELIRGRHNALEHAAALVTLMKRVAPARANGSAATSPTRADGGASPTRADGGAAAELARLARSQWYAEGAAADLRVENAVLRRELNEAHAQAAQARAELARTRAELEAFKRTRRYRLAQLQASPLDALRRRAQQEARAQPDARRANGS